MKKNIRFYKLNSKWYSDVPEHTLEENEMVAGADKFLEKISMNSNSVTLSIDTEETESIAHLIRIEHTSIGATYLVDSVYKMLPITVWLCNVAHTVLGEHPENIYVCSLSYN